MREVEKAYDVGVIVGRFQVPELHDAHVELIESVQERHDKVVLFLGLSEVRGTQNNPLDFEARKQMVLERFPEVNVLYIKDMYSDAEWSKRLDQQIEDVVTPNQSVLLYGGRDSFVELYEGKHPTRVLESERYLSGTVIRKEVSRKRVQADPAFRAGAVWQAFNSYPTAYVTVDIGVFNEEGDKILLVRKPYEDQWRLPGGFISPTCASLEAAARREVEEEAHIAITDPQYVFSTLVDDWRYRNEQDKILTTVFKAKLLHGSPRPDDDVAEAGWFDTMQLSLDADVVPNHRELVGRLIPNHSER
jgi:bifunctional NMN adenylyltransferase/nudix hydrolase